MKTIIHAASRLYFSLPLQAWFRPNKSLKLHLSSFMARGEEVGRSKKLTLS